MRQRQIILLSVGLLILLAGCGNGDPAATGQAGPFAAAGGAATVVSATSGDASVSLKDMKFAPAAASVSTGQTVLWKNTDSVPHNVTFANDPNITSKTLAPGDTFAVKFTQPGTYAYSCTFHPGMDGTLTVTGAAVADSGSSTAPTSTASMSPANMDAAMAASIKAFPAKTEGLGGQPLQPTILSDGTKQFDLTAAVTKWEVSPGKKVDAWTYNGTVPGPMINANVGDKVKVLLHNRLPESTTIHFHGIRTPNDQDGTPFITQQPVEPGADYTYSFTPTTLMTGMYHSHDDAIKQMPNGLFGAILIGAMPIPSGITVTGGNQPLILDDAGTIGLSLNGKSFPATAPFSAATGQWIEVTYYNAGGMDHPMHLHEFPQMVIAKDGYPLSAPYYADTLLVSPGERYTVLIHADLPGIWVWHCHILSHAENDQGMFGMVTALIVK
jgi:FtsP/CotA-like multicopper oxidase with cupredoxin domain/plastocyanin